MCRSTFLNLITKTTMLLIALVTINFHINAQAGNAPMTSLPNFPGPLAIDGFLQRQGVNGDWVAGGLGGSGNAIFTPSGEALVPLCFHFRDKYNTADDEVFSKGYFQDDPNTMKWGLRRATSKTDLNNILVFWALNPVDNHIWIAMTADRRTTGKNSTIDFEFLQSQVLMTGDINTGHDKGFFSAGPHGGRTVGDLVISVKFQNSGGAFVSFEYFQWQPGGTPGTYRYFSILPPAGSAFATSNSVPINVPFGAFGSDSYAPYTFIETAFDITSVIGGSDPGSLPFSLWIKSKSNDNFDDFYPLGQPGTTGAGISVTYFFYDLYTAQLNATVGSQDPSNYRFHWTAIGATNGTFVDPTVTGSLNNYDIPDPIFKADTNYDCISYIYKVTATPIGGGSLLQTYVVINSPCKIGKPINPDQMQQGELLNEANSNNENEFEIYPNPVKSAATINLRTGNGIKDIQVSDLSGRVVQRFSGVTTNVMDLKKLSQGIYLVQVYERSTKKTTTKKLLVTN